MAVAEGTRAVNPQTGQTAIFTNGHWVVQGAQQMPLPEADAKSMEALQQQAQDAQYLDQKSQQFMHTMDQQRPGQGSFATGPALTPGFGIPFTEEEIPNPVHAYVNAQDPRLGNLEAITNQTFVHLRPPGSGPLKAYEAGPFKQAFPNVTNYGPVNQQIANRIHQDALIASSKLAFIDSFIRSGQGDYASANNAWQRRFGDDPAAAAGGPRPVGPPMAMVPDPNSPIGAVPAPGAQPPPPELRTPQQQAILNWTPDKGLHP
jgi:hypothetical protein